MAACWVALGRSPGRHACSATESFSPFLGEGNRGSGRRGVSWQGEGGLGSSSANSQTLPPHGPGWLTMALSPPLKTAPAQGPQNTGGSSGLLVIAPVKATPRSVPCSPFPTWAPRGAGSSRARPVLATAGGRRGRSCPAAPTEAGLRQTQPRSPDTWCAIGGPPRPYPCSQGPHGPSSGM